MLLTMCAMAHSLHANAAHAQSSNEDTSSEDTQVTLAPTEIIVTAERLPDTPAAPAYGTVVLEREAITNTGSGRLEDALSSVAGFQQFRRSDSRSSNPSAQGATLRALGGNASSRAQVLLDGVPLSDPFFGYIPFNAAPPETLGRIRVTRGGGAGPFGAGALAGTIELESAGQDALTPLAASALVNDRGETELFASAAPGIGSGYAVVAARWDRGKGFFTAPDTQRVPASARAQYESWNLSGRLVQPLGSDLTLHLRGAAWDDQRTLRFDGADSSSEGRDASIRLVGTGAWQFEAVGYGQWRNFTNVVISSSRFTRVLDQKDTPSTGLGGKLEVRPPVGADHALRVGVDYRRSQGDLSEDRYSAFSGNLTGRRFAGGRNGNLGLFVEDDWTIGRLVLTGGVRFDRYTIADGYFREEDAGGTLLTDDRFATRKGWETSWRAGVMYDASAQLRLRAATYRGLRLPTLNELYRPFVVFPVVTNANAALENERLEGFEIGADWQAAPGIAFSLTAFDNRVEGAIANVTLAPNVRQRRNLDAIEARGIEAGAKVERGAFRLDASAAYTDAKVQGSGFAAPLDGNRPPQVPQFAASATIAWVPGADTRLALTLRHVGKQFEDDQQSDVLPAATTLDAFAQVPLGAGFSVVARGENLLDEDIVTRNQGGSVDLGVPRTVWIGLRYGF
ncbi:vitamin B12/cobalamin outer membrane transporter [Paraurantiacibacter namhicola]|uniref:Vitamin B12/cobalamin outer membrane transporter n=2 Tax=Paraurantiacibacter namhicola TaxID=645517 RepID=A0A1C7D6Q4_9SPHN|nr:vitamin B12/cobalamin outer membrane transporter [Paraurantiacibacter namhicola]